MSEIEHKCCCITWSVHINDFDILTSVYLLLHS